MSSRNGKLSAKQEVAIATLLSEPTQEAVAQKLGVNVKTLQRWQEQEEFQAAYRSARQQILDGVILTLQRAASQAATEAVNLLASKSERVRLKAIDLILTQAAKWTEIGDILGRLEALEKWAKDVDDANTDSTNGHLPQAPDLSTPDSQDSSEEASDYAPTPDHHPPPPSPGPSTDADASGLPA